MWLGRNGKGGDNHSNREKQSFSSVSRGDKHLPTEFYLSEGERLFLSFFEITLGSKISIRIIQVLLLLLKAEEFHLHIPLKPMTPGLGLFLNAYRRNSKLESKPNNPKGFAFSNFSTAWTTAVFLYKFHFSTARAPGEESSKVGWKEKLNMEMQQKIKSRSAARLWPLTHWFSSCCARHLTLDFLFSSSRVQKEIMSQPGLKGFSAPLEHANNFSDLFSNKTWVSTGSKNQVLHSNLACPTWPWFWSISASLNHSLSNWGNEIQNIKQCGGSDLNQQRQGNCKLSFLLCPWFTLFCSATALFPDSSPLPMPRTTGHRKQRDLNIGGILSYPCLFCHPKSYTNTSTSGFLLQEPWWK